jgi:hypothetical protein
MRRPLTQLLTSALVLTVLISTVQAQVDDRASWSTPLTADVKAQIDDFLASRSADEATRLKVSLLWPDEAEVLDGGQLLDRLAASLAAADPAALEVVQLCQQPRKLPPPPKPAILDDQSQPPLVRNNLRLLYGRWLAQQDFVDEALEVMTGLGPSDVVDPATLLFYQAVGHHRLLNKDECLKTVGTLLENEDTLPRRYATLAKLMQADVQPLKPDSLDEIARLMEDVRRRLDLARAGKKVRDREDEIVAKLDKMIEQMEQQQQQQQQQQQAGNSGGSRSATPMQDSNPADLKGPGEVDPKNIGKKDGWGNLPPLERQEVLQQIGRELPAHFRETIEEYFKRLAQDGVK